MDKQDQIITCLARLEEKMDHVTGMVAQHDSKINGLEKNAENVELVFLRLANTIEERLDLVMMYPRCEMHPIPSKATKDGWMNTPSAGQEM
jgi:hypothetical protein|tara:strand:- start:1423 stop:1695 length:273 start_codon:yes stop_codon:yes gene_type:complete